MSVVAYDGKVVVTQHKKALSFDNLVEMANAVTGESDTTLADAVGSLIDGYGEGVEVESLSVTENGTYTAPEGKAYSPVSVNVSGGSSVTEYGVIFIDYDGTVVETWGSSEVASKTALPDNPSHEGLVAQGWNWSLASIKSYISKYEGSKVCVGQMYETASGLTEIDITLTKVTGLTVTCKMNGNKNWGDGTTDSLTTHTYEDYGKYTITCDGTSIPTGSSSSSGLFGASSSNVNRFWCTAIRIGENVKVFSHYAFGYCRSLTSITIPEGVTNFFQNTFSNCCSLTSVTVPDSVTSFNVSPFTSCYSLTSVAIPDSVTSIGNQTFYHCYSLTSITIPENVTSIGELSFGECCSLTSITIPGNVTSIGNRLFNGCYSLTSITIPENVTSIGVSVFTSCYSLTSVAIPDSVTSIGNQMFNGCYSLTSITIPENVTSFGELSFGKCYSLTSITMPKGVTSIAAEDFLSCNSILRYDFSSATAIPSLSNTNAFSGINGICKIIVPDALYDDWIVATNWATYANYIYKASEVEA